MRLRRQFAERPAKDLKPQLAGEQPVNAVGHPVGIIQCALFHPVPDEIPAAARAKRISGFTTPPKSAALISSSPSRPMSRPAKGWLFRPASRELSHGTSAGSFWGRELAATMTTSALAESRLIISRMGRLTWRESSFHISEVICQYGPASRAMAPAARRARTDAGGHHTARAIAVSRWLETPGAVTTNDMDIDNRPKAKTGLLRQYAFQVSIREYLRPVPTQDLCGRRKAGAGRIARASGVIKPALITTLSALKPSGRH